MSAKQDALRLLPVTLWATGFRPVTEINAGIRMKESYCAKCYRRVYGELQAVHDVDHRLVFVLDNGEQAAVDRAFRHGNKFLLEFYCCADHRKGTVKVPSTAAPASSV